MTLRDEEADLLREYIDGARADGDRVMVIAHGTYLDAPWKGDQRAAEFICSELALCSRAGIAGLVVHLGVLPAREVLKYLPRLKTPTSTLVYLETPAVKPSNAHYETPEKLADLFRAIRGIDDSLCKFALCIDTAHLWSCGVDLQSFEAAEDWIRRLEAVADVIPPDRVMLHLNDSFDERGSGVDHHAPLLQGKIWGGYAGQPQQSGLAAFVDYAVRNNLVVILERDPGFLLDDYASLLRLAPTTRLEPSPD